MSSNCNSPLPDGFIEDLFDQLPFPTRHHLITHLCEPQAAQSHETAHLKDLSCPQAEAPKVKNTGNQQRAENKPRSQEHQHFILSNITHVGEQFLSQNGHTLKHILLICRSITKGHFSNLVELDLRFNLSTELSWGSNYDDDDGYDYGNDEDDDDDEDNNNNTNDDEDNNDEDDDKQGLLDELHSLVPSILSSLPNLKSLTLPQISDNLNNSLPFSLPGLLPVGRSCHLENLFLSNSGLSRAHFKYLALHSNYMFPSLTKLDALGVELADEDDDDDGNKDDKSTVYYMLQWIEKSMPKLAHLSLPHCDLTTNDITKDLTNSPILSQLESLDLGFNSTVKAEGWQTLFTSTQFTTSQGQNCGDSAKMKTLKLDGNPNIQSSIPLLTQNCPYLANLTTLSLDGCGLDDNSIQSICKSKWIRGLESLSLENNNKLTPESIGMITNCAGMQNLTSLQFDHPISLETLGYITQSQYLTRLAKIEIDLSGSTDDDSLDKVLLDFFHSPNASSLIDLSLSFETIPQATMKSILLSPRLSNLEHLTVMDYLEPDESEAENGRVNKWIDAFVSSPNCHKLKSLQIPRCNVTDSNVLSMSQSLHLSNLRSLDLSLNPSLTDDSVKYLAQSEGLWLNKLELSGNPLLTPLAFRRLAQSPRLLSDLWELWVQDCPLLQNKHRAILIKSGWFEGEVYNWGGMM